MGECLDERVAYITARVPWGRGESFVVTEMLSMLKTGVDLVVVPRNPGEEIFHSDSSELVERSINLPLISPGIVGKFITSLFTRFEYWRLILELIRSSRSISITMKNLAVLPKAARVASLIHDEGVSWVHSHWGSTPSTIAYIASKVTGIPWGLTLHRFDITENNLLRQKVKDAAFVRCISKRGKRETLDIVGSEYSDKIKVLHVGVNVPEEIPGSPRKPVGGNEGFTVACPALFKKVKGHRYLVEASSILMKKGVAGVNVQLFGEGKLFSEIREMIDEFELEEVVNTPGYLPHDELIDLYKDRKIQAVVLPSIHTESGDKEGIPVSLMEAMSFGIPVVSTNTGSIPELLGGGAGIIVEEKNPSQLAEAIKTLFGDRDKYEKLRRKGYERVKEEFNSMKIASSLRKLMESGE